MKENTKRYVKLSIILYIVILSVALVGTLAWFIFEKSATISTEENSKIVVGEYLEICLDDGDADPNNDVWISELGFDNVVQHPDVSYNPVTKTMWYPISLDEGDELFYGEDGRGTFSDVTNQDGYFVKLDLKVRASKGLCVYLHRDSYVKGVDMNKTDALGTFSKDAVAGASRVAFFDENGLKTVWVPNEKYELTFDANGVTGFNLNGTAENEYKYLNVQDGIVTKGSEYGVWSTEQLSVGANALADNANANEATPILTFTEAGEKKLTVYIWVEGSDRESNTVLSGGSLGYGLKLIGISEKAASAVNIDDVSYSGGKLIYTSSSAEVGDEILYSYDAQNFTPYSSGNPNLAGRNTVLYVRARETATTKLGPVKEIAVS